MKVANEQLREFTGTESHHPFGDGLLFTDGILTLCQKWECFWLIDAIASHQNGRLELEPFQVWTLQRTTGNEFQLICDDGRRNVLRKQIIKFSDFKDDKVILYLENKVIYLPSER